MAALRPSLPVVYTRAPCAMPRARFVVHETGPAEAPRPRPLDRVHQTIPARHDSRRTEQADRATQFRTMRTRLHLKPGQTGTKQLLAQYGAADLIIGLSSSPICVPIEPPRFLPPAPAAVFGIPERAAERYNPPTSTVGGV